MFDAKEDKKLLIEYARLVLDRRATRIKRLNGLIKSVLIICCWILFAFGVCMFLSISILREGYTQIVCKDDKQEYNVKEETLLDEYYSMYFECKDDLDKCNNENTNLSQGCNNYCLKEIFEPTCNRLGLVKTINTI